MSDGRKVYWLSLYMPCESCYWGKTILMSKLKQFGLTPLIQSPAWRSLIHPELTVIIFKKKKKTLQRICTNAVNPYRKGVVLDNNEYII